MGISSPSASDPCRCSVADTETSNADNAIVLVKQMQKRIETEIGLSITFDYPRDESPSGRAHVEIKFSTHTTRRPWPEAIEHALDAMQVFITHLGGKF